MASAFVTGGAGFIASHLIDLLLEKGYSVTAADVIDWKNAVNLRHIDDDRFSYLSMDVSDRDALTEATKGADIIFHMASNSDIRSGCDEPSLDIRDTLQTTVSVLEAMRANRIKRMFFPSSSTVYGDKGRKLTEDTGDLSPLSYYGACKLASESLISAYSFQNELDALIFRFPNVVGPRMTHGVIYDFIRKLKKDPGKLEILGDGNQRKQYVYVKDLVKGIVDFSENIEKGVSVYNISTDSFATVKEIADMVCERIKVDPEYVFTGGACGWKGDVPTFEYDISKAKAAGWKYQYDSIEAIRKALEGTDLDSIPPM